MFPPRKIYAAFRVILSPVTFSVGHYFASCNSGVTQFSALKTMHNTSACGTMALAHSFEWIKQPRIIVIYVVGCKSVPRPVETLRLHVLQERLQPGFV